MEDGKLSVVTRLKCAEVDKLNEYLESLEHIIHGVNYCVQFEAIAFNTKGIELPVKDVLQMAYPDSKLDSAHIIISNISDLRADLKDCICDYYHDEGELRARNIYYGFRNWLNECIEFDDASIYKYNSWEELPGYACWWYFFWLIHNPEQERCIVLYGYASD